MTDFDLPVNSSKRVVTFATEDGGMVSDNAVNSDKSIDETEQTREKPTVTINPPVLPFSELAGDQEGLQIR